MVTDPDQLAFTSFRAAPKFSVPGKVWGVKAEYYGACSLEPSTDQGSDVLMIDGPQDDGKTSKRPLSKVDDGDSTVRGKRVRAD